MDRIPLPHRYGHSGRSRGIYTEKTGILLSYAFSLRSKWQGRSSSGKSETSSMFSPFQGAFGTLKGVRAGEDFVTLRHFPSGNGLKVYQQNRYYLSIIRFTRQLGWYARCDRERTGYNYIATLSLPFFFFFLTRLATRNSRFMRAIFSSEMPFGHSTSQAPVFVQFPKPSLSICSTM